MTEITKTSYIAFRCPPELHKKLEELARQDDRSVADYCRKILKHHVNKEGENDNN